MFKSIIESISTVTNHGAPSSFKFHILERADAPDSIFELYRGKAKNGMMINIPGLSLDNTIFSIFVFRKSPGDSRSAFALNAMRKMVSLRHPSIVRVYDTAENDNGIYIATEHVTPLTIMAQSGEESNHFPIYGVYQIMKGLDFIHNEAKIFHGNLDPSNLYVDDNGGFRIGGFELARQKPDNTLVYDKRALSMGLYKRYTSTDVMDYDLSGFIMIVYFLATGSSFLPSRCKETSSLSELVQSISSSISDQKIVAFLGEVLRHKTFSTNYNFLKNNVIIEVMETMETIHVKGERESIQWLDGLVGKLGTENRKFQQGVLLDIMLNTVISIKPLIPSSISVIGHIISLGGMRNDEIQRRQIDSKLIDLIRIADRSVRFKILINIPKIICIFDSKILESIVLIEILTGLTDSHPSIREQTMLSLVSISSNVSRAVTEKHIIPSLVRLLKDPEPSIRTNAIVSVGKVIGDDQRQYDMIMQCVMNGLRDPFAPARVTAIKMISAYKFKTMDQGRDLAAKILPILCPLLVDCDYEAATSAYEVIAGLIADVRRLVPPVQTSSVAPGAPTTTMMNPTPPFSSSGGGRGSLVNRPPTTASKLADANFDSFWDDIVKPSPYRNVIQDNSLI